MTKRIEVVNINNYQKDNDESERKIENIDTVNTLFKAFSFYLHLKGDGKKKE